MTIETLRRDTIQGTMKKRREINLEVIIEKTIKTIDRGVNQDPVIEKYPEIDREKEDTEKEAKALEDKGREATALEMRMTVV